METLINNLVNGNISTARKQARRFRLMKIHDTMFYDFGWSQDKSIKAAHFLKTGEDWQAYCDAN